MKSSKKLHDSEKKPLALVSRFNYLKRVHNLNDTDLSLKLGISRGYAGNISAGKVRGKGDLLWSAVRKAFPEWESYLRGETEDPPIKVYNQEEEYMLPRKDHETPDSGPGQQRLPDNLGRYQVVKVYSPGEGQRQGLHKKLDFILDSKDQGLVRAITYNIEEFAKAAEERNIPLKPGPPPVQKGITETER